MVISERKDLIDLMTSANQMIALVHAEIRRQFPVQSTPEVEVLRKLVMSYRSEFAHDRHEIDYLVENGTTCVGLPIDIMTPAELEAELNGEDYDNE
jgi:hypothetical protein